MANVIAEEVCGSMRTVRSFANEEKEAQAYGARLQKTYKHKKDQVTAYAIFTLVAQSLDLGLEVAILFYGGHLVLIGEMSGGALVSFLLYNMELGASLEVCCVALTFSRKL